MATFIRSATSGGKQAQQYAERYAYVGSSSAGSGGEPIEMSGRSLAALAARAGRLCSARAWTPEALRPGSVATGPSSDSRLDSRALFFKLIPGCYEGASWHPARPREPERTIQASL